METTNPAKPQGRWGTILTTGFMIGILEIFTELSLASLIFSGALAPLLPAGAGLLLVGGVVIGGTVLFNSSIPGTLAVPQDAPSALLAIIAAQISASMLPNNSVDSVYYTLLAIITLSSVSTALVFLLIGQLKLGNLVRYIPYPVIGGFLAGTGWLLLVGSIGIMTDVSLTLSELHTFFTPLLLIKWLPGVALGILLHLVIRRTGNIRDLVIVLTGGMAMFYLVLLITRTPLATAREQGLLVTSFSEGFHWKPLLPTHWGTVQWDVVLSQSGTIVTIVLVSVISLLLNTSGIELISKKNADLNQELRVSGWANLLSGLVGSPAGYSATSFSALSLRGGNNTRWVGIVTFSMITGVIFFGSALLSFFPKMLLGALVLFLGIDFLWDWLVVSWNALPKLEYSLIVLILLVIGTVGFLQGVAVGIVTAVVIFAINYSRIDAIRNQINGADFHSNVERPIEQQRILQKHRVGILILKLQGYLFFGTGHNLFEFINTRVHSPQEPNLRFLLLDFEHVNILDSSALNSFKKIYQLAEDQGFRILLTACNQKVQNIFQANNFFSDFGEQENMLPSVDRGIEWCEENILTHFGSDHPQQNGGLLSLLSNTLEVEDFCFDGLMDYLEPVDLKSGEKIIRQGEDLEFLYLIETGWATVYLEDVDQEQVRVRKMGPGTILGELSFFLEYPATASVVLNTDCRLYRMSKAQNTAMELDSPELAAVVHRLITHILGKRLAQTTKTLHAFLD